jgi:hypothetical protein
MTALTEPRLDRGPDYKPPGPVRFPGGKAIHLAGLTPFITACGRVSMARPRYALVPVADGEITCRWCRSR